MSQLDLRVAKNLVVSGARVQLMIDLYNALNASPVGSSSCIGLAAAYVYALRVDGD